MSNLCCVLDAIVKCTSCNTRWCSACWTEAATDNHPDAKKDSRDPHTKSPRVCSLTKRVVGVIENRYSPWEVREGKIGLVFGPLP